MNWTENIFQEFIDALQTAMDEDEFERIATRASHGLGFRWFAYLSIVDSSLKLISSYPKSWTSRYLRHRYHRFDPVVLRARAEHAMFTWGASSGSIRPRNREQSRFFEEATGFGIKSGITVPIRAGFGRMAAFTVATDDALMEPDLLLATSNDIVQLLGLYFHTHLRGRAPRTRHGGRARSSASASANALRGPLSARQCPRQPCLSASPRAQWHFISKTHAASSTRFRSPIALRWRSGDGCCPDATRHLQIPILTRQRVSQSAILWKN